MFSINYILCKTFITLNCFVACEADQFACDDGDCISNRFVCDYMSDCSDHSDERGCAYPPGKLCRYSVSTRRLLTVKQ